jgi:hypothetical protein
MNFFLSDLGNEEESMDIISSSYEERDIIPSSSIPYNLYVDYARVNGYEDSDKLIRWFNKPWEDAQKLYFTMYHRKLSDIFLSAMGRTSNLVYSDFQVKRKKKDMEKRESKKTKVF